jgi:hypothetical protein
MSAVDGRPVHGITDEFVARLAGALAIGAKVSPIAMI